MRALLDAIDAAGVVLRADSPAFTRRNLFHAVRRALPRTTEVMFDAALTRRLRRSSLDGLIVRPPAVVTPSDPRAVLVVDRPSIVHLFAACGAGELDVVCLDGTPAATVSRLRRAFERGARAVALFAHDAATVVYPFSFEPLASLVAANEGAVAYVDLGLPPLGAAPRRFGCDALGDEMIFELEALPPMALVSHCVEASRALDPGDRRRAQSR
jgi:hypothetical protein